VSPKSKGLFQAAIMESGTVDVTFFFQPLAQAKAYYEDLAKRWDRDGMTDDRDALENMCVYH
jgi:carboxylesterase type B